MNMRSAVQTGAISAVLLVTGTSVAFRVADLPRRSCRTVGVVARPSRVDIGDEWRTRLSASSSDSFVSLPSPNPQPSTPSSSSVKDELLQILREKAPKNAATSAAVTEEILDTVAKLELVGPQKSSAHSTADVHKPSDTSDDTDSALLQLAGTWELLWTAQDRSRPESRGPFGWINPLENQSYSNNPLGRAAPVLPRPVQDRLERLGFIRTTDPGASDSVRSIQSIDIVKRVVRNVVTFQVPGRRTASLTVAIGFRQSRDDPCKIDVRFEDCRVRIADTPVNVNIPLGPFGVTGWLRTSYVDEDLRITRGHKGSVFILRRTNAPSVQ